MADPDYSDLIVPDTSDELETLALTLAAAEELPTTSWAEASVSRVLIFLFAELLADASVAVAKIARGGVLAKSTGAWLKELLVSQYDDALIAPVRTVGLHVLTDNGGGPHTLVIGTHHFSANSGELLYVVTALPNGATLSLNGTLEVEIGAVGVGSDYNVPNGSIDEVVTSLPTVTCSNDAVGTTGTWLTTAGSDVESDAAAQVRAPLKWGTLSTGSPVSAYEYWALSTVGVTRATVDDGDPNAVVVYIDSSAAVSTLQATLNEKAPSGTTATATAATTEAVTIPGTVTVRAAYRDTAETDITNNLTDLAGEIAIGGIVRKAEIIERIMSPDGVTDVEIASAWAGAPNIQLGATAIPQFTLSLTFVVSG